ncbi:heme biosynthesis protein HemY [Oceanicella actignis]|uniref:HemY protein n=1 Tax=Oceanicella actignis TaxID=1189325 RepID=A0A1M7TFV0_9RHOB|nr:heme biosynthesis HemY N-terminal domain-containing protein [Oceanicella actignis]TYO88536.1 HemY protein [Oceanicella actignis]SET60888.1 HemY protein [Oceanicella actignis]SHN69541.1 HemY protein [Oceanicella actignis]
MIWLLLRAAVFVALVLAGAWGVSMLLDTPGGVELTWNGRSYLFDPLTFAGLILAGFAALWLLFKLVGLLIAIARLIGGDETALSRFFNSSSQRRGVNAMAESLIALAEGDARRAVERAEKAGRLLDHPELTNLVGAQAASLAGDKARAQAYLKALARDERTQAIGVKGLMKQAMEEGDVERALLLGRRAFALRPRDAEVMSSLFDLETRAEDWAAARRMLAAEVRAGVLPRDVGARRDAVLALAEAREALEKGDLARARDAALEANRRAPDLAPAAVAAAERLMAEGRKRRAEKILRKAWKLAPHPDIARAYAALEPDEDPVARRRRFRALIAENPDHKESRMLEAELALAAEDFPGARAALGDLPTTEPTTRALAIMAAAERGSGADEHVVRAWLAKALSAPRGERWTCEACGHVHDEWRPLCERCRAVDSLAWKQPEGAGESTAAESAMLPLIVGALEAAPTPPSRRGEDAQDAELADAPDAEAGENGRAKAEDGARPAAGA